MARIEAELDQAADRIARVTAIGDPGALQQAQARQVSLQAELAVATQALADSQAKAATTQTRAADETSAALASLRDRLGEAEDIAGFMQTSATVGTPRRVDRSGEDVGRAAVEAARVASSEVAIAAADAARTAVATAAEQNEAALDAFRRSFPEAARAGIEPRPVADPSGGASPEALRLASIQDKAAEAFEAAFSAAEKAAQAEAARAFAAAEPPVMEPFLAAITPTDAEVRELVEAAQEARVQAVEAGAEVTRASRARSGIGRQLGEALAAGVRVPLEVLSNAVDAYDTFLANTLPVLAARYSEAVDAMGEVVEGVRASGIGDELRAFAADVRERSTAEFVGVLAVVREDASRLGRTLNDLLEETLVPGVAAATAVLARVAEESILTVATTALVPFANFASDAADAIKPLIPALLRTLQPFRQLGPAASRLADLLLGPTFGAQAAAAANAASIAQAEALDAVAHAEAVVADVGAASAQAQAAVARAQAAVVRAESAGAEAEDLAAQPEGGRDPIAALAADPTVRSAAESIGAVLAPMAQLGEAAGVVSSAMAGLPPHALALQVVFDSIFQVLAPAIAGVLRPLFASLALVGRIVGQILVPIFTILGGVANALGEVFLWLYNRVFRHVGNLILTIFNAIIDVFNALFGWLVGRLERAMLLDELTRDQFLALGDRFLMEPIIEGDTNITRFQQQRPINLTVNNEGNYVIGDDGLDEFADLVAGNITRNDRLAYG